MIDFNELENEIYGIRLIVLLETSPQSGKYRQVRLNPERFKNVSMAISTGTPEEAILDIGDEIIPLPDLQQIRYDK